MVKIACILINYNGLEDTLNCLTSINKSDKTLLKIFLVNNSPSEESRLIFCNQLQHLSLTYEYIEPEENLGFAAGCNSALSRIYLENEITHVVIMNNDVVVKHDFCSELEKAIEAFPDCFIAGAVIDSVSGNLSFNIGYFTFFTNQIRHVFSSMAVERLDFVSGCLMIGPSSIFKQFGGLNEKYFMYWEDAEFCLRLKQNGVKIIHWPKIEIRHALSSSVIRNKIEKEYYRIRNQTHFVLSFSQNYQKVFYLIYLSLLLSHRALFRPQDFKQSFNGSIDGLRRKLGKIND